MFYTEDNVIGPPPSRAVTADIGCENVLLACIRPEVEMPVRYRLGSRLSAWPRRADQPDLVLPEDATGPGSRHGEGQGANDNPVSSASVSRRFHLAMRSERVTEPTFN
jgi:hypothetical protein